MIDEERIIMHFKVAFANLRALKRETEEEIAEIKKRLVDLEQSLRNLYRTGDN